MPAVYEGTLCQCCGISHTLYYHAHRSGPRPEQGGLLHLHRAPHRDASHAR